MYLLWQLRLRNRVVRNELNKLSPPLRTSPLVYSITITSIRERKIMQVLEVSPELGRYGMRAHVIIGKLMGGGGVLFKFGEGGNKL